MEKHTIEIGTDGSTKITVQGVKGRSCQDATRDIQEALGSTVQDTATEEMYEQPARTQVRSRG